MKALAEDLQTVERGAPEAEPQRSASGTLALLLEVGCEEIPARFLDDAEKGLGERVFAGLREARLLPEASGAVQGLRTYSTPRRLVVHVPRVLARQADQVQELVGPPVKVAVDAEGHYTRAAESFVQKNSARPEDLIRTTTPKGEYLALRKTTPGCPAGEVLRGMLPAAVLSLSFPKNMYWLEKSGPRFVRPIRWIVALLGEGKQAEIVQFEVLGVKSGDSTFGHRAKGLKPRRVTSFKDYMKKLAQANVEIDKAMRSARVQNESKALVEELGLRIVQDEWLTDWIANSTEWPRPMLGSLDERFLHLPREILITVMRDHQRYFAVEDGAGNLRPNFVVVLNKDSDPKGLIRQGHQRVLTARFRDAEFFWKADQQTPLAQRVGWLDRVTYQAGLGSYGDKMQRMRLLAGRIAGDLETAGVLGASERAAILRAVELSKCDLTTQMVQEFTELQGVVGGLYAKVQGELEEVATAVYDHYLPLGAEGKSPRSMVGAVVSLADKLDSVAAGFAAGHEPTGSSDPFALRRQANGIVKVLLEFKFSVSLRNLLVPFDSYLGGHMGERRETAMPWSQALAAVEVFFGERVKYYLEEVRHFRYDTVRAVLAAGRRWDDPLDAERRAEALHALRGGEDFEALSAAAKRIRNILAKSASASDWQPGEVDAELVRETEERDLHAAYGNIFGEVERLRQSRQYQRALEQISTLRPAVDRFFDKVLVMAEDRAVRQNRLRLLKKLDDLFSGIAYLAEIEGQ